MKFCTMCGQRCRDDQHHAEHTATHFRQPDASGDYDRHQQVAPGFSCREAYYRAFLREPTPMELERIASGDAQAVFDEASAALS